MFWKDLCFQKLYSIGLELYIYLNTDLIFQMDKTNDIFSFIFVKSGKIVCWHLPLQRVGAPMENP